MEKFFSILTTCNSILAFYFILTSLRQLTYGENGDVSSPPLTGIFFLSAVLVSHVLKKIAGQIWGSSVVSKKSGSFEL